jgi:Ca2+-binding RTX toxin-like protein
VTVQPPSDLAQQSVLEEQGRCSVRKTGNSGNNFLAGTDGGDRIKGKGGDDSLRGKGGDDCLSGGTENDRLNGGSGEDLLKGGAGDDVIYAKDGEADKIRCGFGDDQARVDAQDTVSACEHVS